MNLIRRAAAVLVVLPMAVAMGQRAAGADGRGATAGTSRFLLYVGTYTGPKSKGIYVSRFDAASGGLSAAALAAETTNPTFLAVHPSLPALYSAERPVLYAVNETGWGGKSGTIAAYAIDRRTGRLALLNSQPSRGSGPCHVSVDASGKCVLAANYGSGSVAALPVRGDGSLGEAVGFVQHAGLSVNPKRQEGPHAHFIQPDPGNRFAVVCDLGLDQVLVYRLDAAKATLERNEPPFTPVKRGSGPRHLAFHPTGRQAYLINELSSTMTAFTYDARHGTFQEFQSLSTLPEGCTNQSTTAEVEVHPSGRYLYGSNRGDDSLAVFALERNTGRMRLVQHQSTLGKTPRYFAIDPTGRWLLAANQGTDNVVVFRIDPGTGKLTPSGSSIEVGGPVCLKFVPAE